LEKRCCCWNLPCFRRFFFPLFFPSPEDHFWRGWLPRFPTPLCPSFFFFLLLFVQLFPANGRKKASFHWVTYFPRSFLPPPFPSPSPCQETKRKKFRSPFSANFLSPLFCVPPLPPPFSFFPFFSLPPFPLPESITLNAVGNKADSFRGHFAFSAPLPSSPFLLIGFGMLGRIGASTSSVWPTSLFLLLWMDFLSFFPFFPFPLFQGRQNLIYMGPVHQRSGFPSLRY